MATVRLVLGDQLNPGHSWFGSVDPAVVYVLMEVRSETDYVVHHAQKVIAIFAGMRRLAEQLRAAGHRVRYFRIGDADNRQNFAENLRAVFAEVGATRFEYQEPDEWRVDQDLTAFAAACGLPTTVVSAEHFLDARGGVSVHFQKAAKRWLMESYYRKMRVRTRLLMDADGSPLGGEWNYDAENRKPWKGTPPPPAAWDELARAIEARLAGRAPVWVKWPNDVLAGPPDDARKLAGVLVEAQLRDAEVTSLVIGVGVNVRTSAFPAELAAMRGKRIAVGGAGSGAAAAAQRRRRRRRRCCAR